MKKLFVIISLIFLAQLGFAQRYKPRKTDTKDYHIKLEVPNLIYGDYSLTGEMEVWKNKSISLRMGYLKPFSYVFRQFNIDDDNMPKGFDTSFEFRFYVAGSHKEDLEGLYVAPYLRYANLNLGLIDEINYLPIDVKIKYSNFGGGIQLGCQGKFHSDNKFLSHIVYDFHLLGVGADNHVLSLAYDGLKDSQDFEDGSVMNEILRVVEQFPILSNAIDIPQLNNLVNAPLPILLPGFRAGFSIGYAF